MVGDERAYSCYAAKGPRALQSQAHSVTVAALHVLSVEQSCHALLVLHVSHVGPRFQNTACPSWHVLSVWRPRIKLTVQSGLQVLIEVLFRRSRQVWGDLRATFVAAQHSGGRRCYGGLSKSVA